MGFWQPRVIELADVDPISAVEKTTSCRRSRITGARDAALGSLLCTFVGDQNLSYSPVIANGYVYVASAQNTYAVSIATHASAWTVPFGGWLAVAARRLVISGGDGFLRGYVLSP